MYECLRLLRQFAATCVLGPGQGTQNSLAPQLLVVRAAACTLGKWEIPKELGEEIELKGKAARRAYKNGLNSFMFVKITRNLYLLLNV